MPWVVFIALYVAAIALTLVGEQREQRTLKAVGKLSASTIFLIIALVGGALDSGWGQALLIGLVFGWLGDACLLSKERRWFMAGLVVFLLGHLAYCVAFMIHGVALGPTSLALGLLIAPALVVDRWLRPHVPDSMRIPVRAYVVIISVMLALAIAAWLAGAPGRVLAGALAFYASDLSVARDRFVSKEFGNRLWGLPAYYLGQLLFALSV